MIYVDESIQHNLGYICVGFAYCEDVPDELIAEAIYNAGLTPGEDEYKSGYRMDGVAARHLLRESIYQLVQEHCRIGVYIAPVEQRERLLSSVVDVAKRLVEANRLSTPQDLYVDQGISGDFQSSELINVITNCDSRLVCGIQLADFVAYHCSYLIKCELLDIRKKIFISEEDVHPLSGESVELDWMLRTDFRRNFFTESKAIDQIEGDDWSFNVSGYGSFFGNGLCERVKGVAEGRFGSVYLGCVW